jgi:hypothetical protein
MIILTVFFVQEQRNYVESGAVPTENIYATLEEVLFINTSRSVGGHVIVVWVNE